MQEIETVHRPGVARLPDWKMGRALWNGGNAPLLLIVLFGTVELSRIVLAFSMNCEAEEQSPKSQEEANLWVCVEKTT